MKRLWWVIRIAVIAAASYCIFAPGGSQALPNVKLRVATQPPPVRGIVTTIATAPM
jgi:hypothetical protein